MCAPDSFDVYEHEIEWVPVSDLYGFDGTVPAAIGNLGKYLGRPGDERGPWFYIVKHPPHTRVPRHSHSSAVSHFLLDGSWLVGDDEPQVCVPGFFHHEDPGAFWGPLRSGPEGSRFIAVYSARPDFIPAAGNEAGYVDPYSDSKG
ncbi:hypothetical protein [Antrihabitans sp. YC2-6]|uniref:hypothetical protein n=1 Tax=Antrihabitans sp. YC2-6 TaxID=2799498 RepID=UPI0018F50DBE|nr:hypothetical protein [Antrihabitans sp. YC2-6]MBJ8347213.1 hypothetical protein [Antrihabitans sp. YC2-6]